MAVSLLAEKKAIERSLVALVQSIDLKIDYVNPHTLVARGRKTRTRTKKAIEALARVIAEFGFLVPIIVDEAGKILAGNGRLEAALLLGLTTVPVVTITHLTQAQKRLYVIADNRLAELAGWDNAALAIELEEIRNLDVSLDIELSGFSLPQIDGIVALAGQDNAAADRLPLPVVAPTSRIGDLWHLGEHRLICGDATDAAVFARVLAGAKARTVFTDPPFNVPIRGNVTQNKRHDEFVMGSGEMNDEQFTAFLMQFWGNVEQALLPGGLAYVAMDWKHLRNILNAMNGKALDLLNIIVWSKTAAGMGSFYRSQHEFFCLTKKPGGDHKNRIQLGSNGRNRSNIWVYEGVNGSGFAKAKSRDLHPTVKPMVMVRDALLDSSDPGDVVLDPFSGSGTTLIAAEVSKRKGRAIELDPIYADTSVVRWQDFTGKEAILAETGEAFAQVRARRAVAHSAIKDPLQDDQAAELPKTDREAV